MTRTSVRVDACCHLTPEQLHLLQGIAAAMNTRRPTERAVTWESVLTVVLGGLSYHDRGFDTELREVATMYGVAAENVVA